MLLGLPQAFTLYLGPCATHPLKGHTWWLRDDYHIAGQADITGSSALEWDGGALEVV